MQLPLAGLAEEVNQQQRPPLPAETQSAQDRAKAAKAAYSKRRKAEMRADPERWAIQLQKNRVNDARKYRKFMARLKSDPIAYAAWKVKMCEANVVQRAKRPKKVRKPPAPKPPPKPRPPKKTIEEIMAKRRAYNNRPDVAARRLAYYRNRKQNDPAYAEECRRKDAEGFQKSKHKIYARIANRRATDPVFRMTSSLRTYIYQSLGIKRRDGSRFKELVGCSVEELKAHLQSQFKPGMTLQNYGAWEIDHIRPLASFRLEDEAEQRRAFHWSNCQPLWKLENRLKSDKLPPGIPHPNPAMPLDNRPLDPQRCPA